MIALDPKLWEYYLLALCLWREARGEGYDAQCGVVHTVLNRLKARTWFGASISEIVSKPWQFSSMSAPGDRQLTRFPLAGDSAFTLCLQVVEDCCNGRAPDPTRGADHFYDDSIAAPAWARSGEFKAKFGKLNFYRVP